MLLSQTVLKKKLSILISLLFILNVLKGQEFNITMTTALPIGSVITFSLAANANNVIIQVDFGNGIKKNKTIGISVTSISDTLVGSQIVKIYGSEISTVMCPGNQLTTLDVTNNIALTYLWCSYNQLAALDLSNNVALIRLDCESNQLASLDLTNNTVLVRLNCELNHLTELDLTQNIALEELYCSDNQLGTLDITQNTAMTILNCESNQLTELKSNNTALSYLSCGSNKLNTLEITKNTALTGFNCMSNQLTALDITNNTRLINLTCLSNHLTTLDVSNNTALISFFCCQNQLSALDITQNTALTFLNCSSNRITSLDATKNTELTELICTSNQLNTLDVSGIYSLKELYCDSNLLTFATLPIKRAEWDYIYAPQKPIPIPKELNTGVVVDLSDKHTINGNFTYFTWKNKSGSTLFLGLDYAFADGKTIFLRGQTDSVYCQMTNDSFPNLTGTNILKTTFTKVSSVTEVEQANNLEVQLYSLNKTLFINMPYDAHLSVFDTSGRLIVSKSVSIGMSNLTLQNTGIYLVRISGLKDNFTQKVFVE